LELPVVMPLPPDERAPQDAGRGVLTLHDAADGRVARVREHWAACERPRRAAATPVTVAVRGEGGSNGVELRDHGDTWQVPSLARAAARLELEAPR